MISEPLMSLEELVAKCGWTGKLVRAICRERGWRYVAGSPPEAWYAAWRAGLGVELNEIAGRRQRP